MRLNVQFMKGNNMTIMIMRMTFLFSVYHPKNLYDWYILFDLEDSKEMHSSNVGYFVTYLLEGKYLGKIGYNSFEER